MKRGLFCWLLLGWSGFALAESSLGPLRWTNTGRFSVETAEANPHGALGPVTARLDGGRDNLSLGQELRGGVTLQRLGSVDVVANLRFRTYSTGKPDNERVLNVLSWNHQFDDWYASVGKKMVSWDVGYAFRPLDVVQQEVRRSLVSQTLEGVPVLQAERFWQTSALSVVIANPMRRLAPIGNQEPAVALRGFVQRGATDWHVVVRLAQETGWRAGVGFSQVVSEALELHASALRAESLERMENRSAQSGLVMPADYALRASRGGWQALAGGTWTAENKLSLLGEAWYDGRAWSPSAWRDWRSGARGISQLPLPEALRSGLLASQAGALRSPSLHRDNLLLRLAWADSTLEPSAEWLLMPADGGSAATLRLVWRANTRTLELGHRTQFGPAGSVARSLPSRSQTYLTGTVAF